MTETTAALAVYMFATGNLGKVDATHVVLSDKETAWLRYQAQTSGLDPARVIVQALRVYDLYLSGRLQMKEEEKEMKCAGPEETL